MWITDLAANAWSYTKKIVIPTIISVARLGASAGFTLFTMPKLMKYITGSEKHIAGYYVTGALIVSKLIVEIPVRVFRAFGAMNTGVPTTEESEEVPEDEIEAGTRADEDSRPEEMKLNLPGKLVYMLLSTCCIGANATTYLGTYLGVNTLLNTIINYINNTENEELDEDYQVILVQVAAALIAVPVVASAITFYLQQGLANAKRVAGDMKGIVLSCEKGPAAGTIAVTIIGVLPGVVTSYFSNENAFRKMPGGSYLNDEIIINLSVASAGFMLVSSMLNTCPVVYNRLATKNIETKFVEPLCLEGPMKSISYTAGLGDAAGSAVSSFTSFVYTASQFAVNEYNIGLIVASTLFSGGNALTYYALNVDSGIQRGFADLHRMLGHTEYPAITTEGVSMPSDTYQDEIDTHTSEATIINESQETAYLYSGPSYAKSQLIFYVPRQDQMTARNDKEKTLSITPS